MTDLASLNGATVVFDLDGTLVDTAPDLVACLNRILVDEGLEGFDLESGRKLVGHGARRMLERGFERAGRPLEDARSRALLERFIPLYVERIAEESRPFPGSVETLDRFRAAGARLCVCTNKLTNLSEALLDALELSSRFDAIVGPDATSAYKPDPRHLLETIERAGGDPARAVFVGDATPDAGAARSAEVPSIGVTFGYPDAPIEEIGFDVLIDGYDELPAAVVERLGAARA